MRALTSYPIFAAKRHTMQIKNKTILITGGSSGVGLELAEQLVAENTVLICGRSQEKLDQAKANLPALHTFQCDLAEEQDRYSLIKWVQEEHAELSILFNNAAIANSGNFFELEDAMSLAQKEMDINFIAPLHLSKALYPLLQKQSDSAIVNISSGLAYSPLAEYSFYNATKAALHSFTQGLQLQGAHGNTQVVEVLLPVVDTLWHKGETPKGAISAKEAVDAMLKGIRNGQKEIRVGLTKVLYLVSRISPKLASKILNG